MELMIRFWKNFKIQPEIWFFYGFLLTFTLTIRKILWFFPLRCEFNEYSGSYLYLSDIFLGLTLIAWIITILYNKIDLLSILKNVPPQKQGNCSTWNNSLLRGRRGTMIYIILPLTLVAWSFISLVWSENKIVSIFRSVKILEFYLLYIFILVRLFYWNRLSEKECSVFAPCCGNVPSQKECSTPQELFHVEQSTGQEWNILRDKRGTILKKTLGLIMIIGLFQAIIGVIQFLLQHSVGLFLLKESFISPDIAGVAKVIFNGEAFVRAYGLFPHPNVLGGFLMFSILVSLLYYRMFHARSVEKKCSIPVGMFHVEHHIEQTWNNFLLRFGCETIIFKLILGIQLLALILTFSKSAILGLILGVVFLTYVSRLPRSKEMFHVEHFFKYWGGTFINFFMRKKRLIITASLIIIFSLIIAKPDFYSLLFKGLDERAIYIDVSRGTIWDNPVLGIGNGQFVISMENLPIIKENWMLEPVHNVFLLVWSELGLIGFLILVLFLIYIFRMFHACPVAKKCSTWNISLTIGVEQFSNLRNKKSPELIKTFGAVFIGLLFIMFFDHYLWDIQQGSFLLWMTLGFLVGAGERKENIDKI